MIPCLILAFGTGIDEYVLTKNGLRVLLLEDHSAPVATAMVTYHVGSRNEAIGTNLKNHFRRSLIHIAPVGYTGATHLLEHLMFKGAKDYNKESGKSIWTVGALGQRSPLPARRL